MYFVRADDIDWADAQGNYVRLHAGGKAHMLRRSFSDFEASLDPRRFARIHRSTIVNLGFVERMEQSFNYTYEVFLRGIQTPLALSRRYAVRLKRQRA